MSKTKKVILLSVTLGFIISIILVIVNPEKFPVWITSIISIFGLFSAYIQFIYKNWDQFYLYINRKIAMRKGDTVGWTASYKFFSKTPKELTEYGVDFSKSIKSKLDSAKIKDYYQLETKVSFDLNYKGYDRKIELFFDAINLESKMNSIRLKYSCSVSYKDSKKEFENFEEIIEILKNDFVLYTEDLNKIYSPLYTVNISFNKLNPFYKLAVRHIDTPKEVNFKLNFTEKNSTIKMTNNEIEVITKKKEELVEILENYTALVSVGN